VQDPDGRPVVIPAQRWTHITTGPPELRPHHAAVLQTIQTPTLRRPGRRAGEVWYSREGVGPSHWLKGIVAYDAAGGRCITAFARRSPP